MNGSRMTEIVLVFLGVVLIAAAVYAIVRSLTSASGAPSVADARPATDGVLDVTLPVDDADPSSPATARLVKDAAHRALAKNPDVMVVLVRSRGGRELGRVERTIVAPATVVEMPAALLEPHAPRHAGPQDPVASPRAVHGPAHVRFEDAPVRHRTLAEHFELPKTVTSRVVDPEDAVDIVRSIMEASGRPFTKDGSTFRFEDRLLIVLHTPAHVGVDSDALNAAFIRFQASRARSGVVLTAGALHGRDVHRREALAPALRHAGADGIQRMADAVAVGADPLDFVVDAV